MMRRHIITMLFSQGITWNYLDSIYSYNNDTFSFSYEGNFSYGGWNRDDSDYSPIFCNEKYGGALGRGLFKIFSSTNPPNPLSDFYYFLVTRDCNIPELYELHDISFLFTIDNYNSDVWYYSPDTLGTEWHIINKGDTIKFWVLKGVGYCRDCFQPTTPENLILSYINNHPQLTWNLSEPKEAAIYEIYRKVCYGPPKYLNCDFWGIAGYTGTGDTTWIDNEFNTNGTESKAYYKVRTVSGDGNLYSPGWSNVVSTEPGTFTPYIKDETEQISEIVDPAPVNIYPNPFNSSIRFRFNIPGNDIRKIELFNLHGELLRMLEVNGTCMEVTWDGIDSQGRTLPSGLYLVVIKSGSRVIHQDKILYLK